MKMFLFSLMTFEMILDTLDNTTFKNAIGRIIATTAIDHSCTHSQFTVMTAEELNMEVHC